MTDHAILNGEGQLVELHCKKCGKLIGKLVTAGDGSKVFERYNYLEMKVRCDDGSFHVTNGCDKCLKGKLSMKQIAAFLAEDAKFDAGLGEMHRKPVEVIAFGVGIP